VTVGDRQGDDDWDVVLDEDFVRQGRSEATADERAALAARISRDHARAQAWRSAPSGSRHSLSGSGAGGARAARRHLRNVGLVVVLAALMGATYLVPGALEPRQDRVEAAVEATSSPSPTGIVTKAAAPLGTPAPSPDGEGGFRFLGRQNDGSGQPVAFDPCREIHYVVRPDHAPGDGIKILRAAIAEVSRATGLVLVDDGTTGESPSQDRPRKDSSRYGAGYSPVLIVWSDASESPRLAGSVAGFAGPDAITGGVPGSLRYVTGQVVLDAADFRRALDERDGGTAARGIVLHELGHLVGLNHVANRHQLMFKRSDGGGAYADGDLRGLNALGRGDCFAG
jgi:hypothetical protein